MTYDSRNTIFGFADRVQKNLAFLTFARNMGADVHIVTQLVTSLLGLIVFPFEAIRRTDPKAFAQFRLEALASQGWPTWHFGLGSSENLGDLLFHLRNAISHRRLEFSSDSRELSEVSIRFWDRKNPDGPDHWGAEINAADLHKFVTQLADLLRGL